MMQIRFALDEVLAEKNISRYMLAKLTQTHYQTIDNYYKNKVKRYDSFVLEKMCAALDCDICGIIELKK